MLKVRVIPCLDVKDGRVVKGINFVNLRTKKLGLQVLCQRQIRDNDAFRILIVGVTNLCSHY